MQAKLCGTGEYDDLTKNKQENKESKKENAIRATAFPSE
jgi:hypothetical protein